MTDDNVLRFTEHNFALFCYDCSNVHVVYGRRAHDLWDEGKAAPARTAADARRYPNAKFGTYRAFETPLDARWSALDGTPLSCQVDLDAVFPERIVPHTVDPRRIYRPMPISGRQPTILVEIDDRTLSVYIDATIQTLPEGADPLAGRDETDCRTLAFTRTL